MNFLLSKAFDPATWSNWAVVLVGSVAAWVAWCTLRKLSVQVEIMTAQTQTLTDSVEVARRSADAAVQAAEAARNVDRAWLIVEPSWSGDIDNLVVKFSAQNAGHSPAEIINYEVADPIFLNPEEHLPDNPSYGTFADERCEISDVTWLLPEQSMAIGRVDFAVFRENAPELFEKAKSLTLFVFVFGFIRYRDTINRQIHETRFCYQLVHAAAGRFALRGGPKYNSIT